ncbi:MAG: radical SAM protein, partial [Gammaproteobacteria bacterium]|nr:radical SAM protein [Gammaproteobacteria bacterium]
MSYRLRISEIFYSLQGESTLSGLPTVFIRLTGCPLRCQYCDTTYAFKGGETMQAEELLQQVAQYSPRYICVTGGEPLAQKDSQKLLVDLCDQGYQVSLETSGSLDISAVDERVIRVMDLKTPASGEVDKNRYENLDLLTDRDQLKFVICGEGDYQWAKQKLDEYKLVGRCEILFSAAEGQLKP